MIPLNVLVVEDDRAAQSAFERFVKEHSLPITYVLAGSLKEAKDLLGQGKFDLIVADPSLEDGTVMDLLPLTSGIPVILLTGEGKKEIAARICPRGISDNLVKSDSFNYLEQLPERLEKAVGQWKRTAEKLLENQALYCRVMDTVNEGIWIADQDDTISYANLRMAEMLGYKPEEMVGLPIQQFLFAEDPADFTDRTIAGSGTAPSQYEIRFRHKNGSPRWTLISTTTLNEQGKLRGLLAMVTDINERKRVEKELQELKQRLLSIYDAVGDVIFQLAVEKGGGYRFASVNQAFLTTTGLTSLQVVGKRVDEVIPEPSLTLVLEKYKEAIHKKRIVQWEEISKYPAGQLIGKVSVAPVFDSAGNCTYLIGSVHDITARKRIDEELSESEEWHRVLVETSGRAGIGIVVLQDTGNRQAAIVFANEAVSAISGYSQEELFKMSLEDVIPPDISKQILSRYRDRQEGKPVPNFYEVAMMNKDHVQVPIITNAATLRFHGKAATVVFFRDITELKRGEEALAQVAREWQITFDAVKDMIWLLDKEQRVLRSNAASERFFQRPCSELVGTHCWELMHGTSEPIPACPIRRVRTSLRRETMELQLGNGWFVVTADPILDVTGQYAGAVHIVSDITERKRAEEVLRMSEERFHSLFDNSTIGLYRTTPDGEILLANPTLCQMLGFASFEDLAHRNLEEEGYQLGHPRQIFRRELEENGNIRALESAWKRKDGSSIFVRESARAVRDANNRTLYYEGTVEDITERKKAEEALRTAEANYRNLFERIPSGLYRSTPEGRFLEVNPAMVDLFGYSSVQELMTLDIGSAFYRSCEERRQWVEKLLQAGELRNTESHVLRKDGSSMVLLENSRVVRDESGKVLFIEGTLTDITERKRAEEALQRSEEKYRLVIETMQDGVYKSSHEGKFLEVNPAMVKILGYDSKEELLAIDIKSQLYFSPEDRESVDLDENLEELSAFRLRKKDGMGIWVEAHGRQVADSEGTILYHEGVIRDITERKQLEERIQQVRSDLLFTVSHDLKTPLMVLNQSKEMLSALAPGEALARFQEYRQIWQRNLQRLEQRINNLVDSQRGEEGRFPLVFVPCRLEEITKRVVENLTGFALTFRVTFDLDLQSVPECSCDEEAIGRVVENILTNAVKFSPKGGQVEIRLGMEGDAFRLEVEDHGAGIPANEQAKLFQPFQRGCSAQQKGVPGTGLGLYVSRRIIEEHGGSILLQSAEGMGTTVTVKLHREPPASLSKNG